MVLRDYDKALYKKRNQVEGMVGDLKHFSRVAVRQDSALLPVVRPARGQLLMAQINVDRT